MNLLRKSLIAILPLLMILLWILGCTGNLGNSTGIGTVPPESSPHPKSSGVKAAQPDSIFADQSKPLSVATETEESPEVKGFSHTVQWPGENLYTISRWYTGSAKNWTDILSANPDVNPRRINIGDTVLIPQSLLKTSQPMPKSFVYSSNISAKQRKHAPSPNQNISKEVDLFGPIDSDTQLSNDTEGNGASLPLQTID